MRRSAGGVSASHRLGRRSASSMMVDRLLLSGAIHDGQSRSSRASLSLACLHCAQATSCTRIRKHPFACSETHRQSPAPRCSRSSYQLPSPTFIWDVWRLARAKSETCLDAWPSPRCLFIFLVGNSNSNPALILPLPLSLDTTHGFFISGLEIDFSFPVLRLCSCSEITGWD